MIFSYYLKYFIVSIVAFILCGINWIVPFNLMKISVNPAVFETGADYYAIVWETSLKGSGCVKYTYNGEEKTVWDSHGGVITTGDTVHVVKVPKNELQGNSYKVCSQFVGFKFAYLALKGKVCESEEIAFKGQEKEDNIKALCLVDIHENEKHMRKAVSFIREEPDILFMIGDITSAMRTKEQFTKFILKDAAEFSGGSIPVVYTRGNHETRGEFSTEMGYYLPTVTDEFYYTFTFGGLSAVVLDGGEDKEDEHKEYSGLVNFADYREKQLGWLRSLNRKDLNGKYNIVLSHEPVIDNFFGEDWTEPLKKLGADLIVGGHWHEVKFVDGELPVLIAGGKSNEKWVATLLTFNEGTISMKIADQDGTFMLEESIDT